MRIGKITTLNRKQKEKIMKLLKRLTFALGILIGVVSIGMGAMSNDELQRAIHNCYKNNDKSACEALIDNGLPSVEKCDKDACVFVGVIYDKVGHYREAIPYFEKAIALGYNDGYGFLGDAYYKLADNFNAKKYYEIACKKDNGDLAHAENCYNLGTIYLLGKGVRQDYHKARELYKKACDMKYTNACLNLGFQYSAGLGVRQNLSIAKQYYGKACDLGEQLGCDDYRKLNEQGVR